MEVCAILLVALAQIVIVIGLLALPPTGAGAARRIARAPGTGVPLGDLLLDVGVTPMPTALPVPVNAVGQTRITIPALATAAIIPEETAVPPGRRSPPMPKNGCAGNIGCSDATETRYHTAPGRSPAQTGAH